MHVLGGDIGGTKTALSIFEFMNNEPKLIHEQTFPSQEFGSLEDIISLFLKGVEKTPLRACFGIAGPIENNVAHTTNLSWTVDSRNIEKMFGIKTVHLINDLVANAFGVKTLKKEDFVVLNEGEAREGPFAIFSAGTGLGMATILEKKGIYSSFPSEGGHADFAPQNDIEYELYKYLQLKLGHVSLERVVSGIGLVHLYQFLIDSKKELESKEVREEIKKDDPARVITKFAEKKACQACEKALKWFCGLYGSFAGNYALNVLPYNGLYLGGGIAPKILGELKEGDFMSRFVAKGRFAKLLSHIPVYVIQDQSTALKGAGLFAYIHE